MFKACTETWSVALEIILLCARGSLSTDQIDRLQVLCQTQNKWQLIFEMALQHRVFPLVYKNLRKYCSDYMPMKVQDQGKQIFRNNGAKNLLMTGNLTQILSLLKENNIPAMPFKGPLLAIGLYGDSSLRNFCDIDVLIRRKDLPRAVKSLAALEFFPAFPLNDKQLMKLSATDNEFPLQQKTNAISLDLQWEITGGYFPGQITFESLYGKCQTMQIAGNTLSIFSNEDLLFYLCVHGNQHTWKQLDHICSIAGLLVKCPKLDWNTVFLTATKYQGVRILSIGLLLAQDLFKINIPDRFSNQLQKDQRALELAQQISSNLQPLQHSPANSVSHRFMRYHFLSMDTPWLAIRYALRLVFVPTRYDWQKLRLPASCSFAHYIIRPFRLAFDGINTFLKCK